MLETTFQSASLAVPRSTDSDFNVRTSKIIYSTMSGESIVDLVLSKYDLPQVNECVLYYRGVGDIYRVITSDGCFALRLGHANRRTREAILGELTAIRHVHRNGAGVALPIARADGDWTTEVQAPEGLRPAVLFEWVSGIIPKYTDPTHTGIYGMSLAKLHRASDSLPRDPIRPVMDINYFFVQPLAFVLSRLAHRPLLGQRLRAVAEKMVCHIDHLKPQLGDWGFCHGDVWAENARLDGTHLALFDFDFCGWGWRIGDLAGYKFDTLDTAVRNVAWQSFLDGYLEVRPDAARFLHLTGLFVVFYRLLSAAHLINYAREVGTSSTSDEFLERIVSFCEQAEANVRAQ